MKRGIATADKHCGHESGLTPPDFQLPLVSDPTGFLLMRRNRLSEMQKAIYSWYKSVVKKFGPYDFHFDLGDQIDGRGEKSGSTELIMVDRKGQTEMAIRCNEEIKAKKRVMVYGTGYHTGNFEDWETLVAEGTPNTIKIGGKEQVDINGCIFDLRHKVGRSIIPHGRATPLARQALHNALWAERGVESRADFFLRGHVHYEYQTGDSTYTAMSLPGLEWSTKFGVRQVEGTVSVGVTIFDVDNNGRVKWHWEILSISEQRVQLLRI
jgi:hypothetical protein